MIDRIYNDFDAIVVGAGHAGCEAGLALARMGQKTLMISVSLDNIAYLACNPSIGGSAKGQLVSEIDALGGEMGVNADKTLIQLRLLNLGKGPAVHSLRAQADKIDYHNEMKTTLENQPNLVLRQAEVSKILVENGNVTGIQTTVGEIYNCRAVILCTGVYLKSRIVIGSYTEESGPSGFKAATKLTESLKELGFEIFRFKTGTPVRIYGNTIDYSVLEEQKGDENIQTFSYLTKSQPANKVSCYLCYTNENTHQIIRDNLEKSPIYSGLISGTGPRYCPSIETKVVRFADKERHQLFLEPESLHTKEVYVQGLSNSMPVEYQRQIVQSIKGLEKAIIMRDSYSIEYDCINSLQLLPTLQYKNITGIYCAGQINGTSGYEEAAAQGIIAGINAALFLQNKPPFILKRDEAYIGVLIDDLVTKGTNEPYRMMTSRAEYRLLLRQDNADLRLTEKGREIGLVTDERYGIFTKKLEDLEKCKTELSTILPPNEKVNSWLKSLDETPITSGASLRDILKRNLVTAQMLQTEFGFFKDISAEVLNELTIQVKYEGYIARQLVAIEQYKKLEDYSLPTDYDYQQVKGIRLEARQKLNNIKPLSIGQASRISGVSPADISVLMVFFKNKSKK